MYIHENVQLQKPEVEREILRLLDVHCDAHQNSWICFQDLSQRFGKQVFSQLFHLLAGLDLAEERAEDIFFETIEHQNAMTEALGRNPGFRVAMFDYLTNMNPQLSNPKIIEFSVYQDKENLMLVDELTGLFNRRYCNDRLEREWKISRRYRRPFAIILFDIDNFKFLNDTYGHPRGDQVLKSLADVFLDNIRSEDTICRIGEEEFLLILPDATSGKACSAANKIREEFHGLHLEKTRLSLSGGVASFPEDALDTVELLERADKNLYIAKKSGKNMIISQSEDKRREIRMPVSWDVRYKRQGEEKPSQSRDISINGISFVAAEKLELNDVVTLSVIAEQVKEPFLFTVKVTWVQENVDDGGYVVGGFFVNASEGYRGRLRRILRDSDPVVKKLF